MNRKLLRRMTLPLIMACLVLADCSSRTSTSAGPTTAFAALRFTTGGVLDTSFAGGGIAITDVDPGLFDFALAAAVQADGKILAAGSTGFAGSGLIAMVRYNADGSLDTTGFGTSGTGGIVRTPTPAGWSSASASAIAVQPADQKILVAALTFAAGTATTGIALLRYNPNGTLDTSFNLTGIVTATIGPGLSSDTCALVLQPDTKIVVAGATTTGNLVLYRYLSTGVLDTTGFGTNGTTGTTTTSLGANTSAMSPGIAFQSVGANAGKIIVVSGTNVDQVVLRYGTNGVLDTTFGTLGVVTTDVPALSGSVNFANAVAVQPADDAIVVAGHANVNFSADGSDISLVRYTADGTLDNTFGLNANGIVTTDLGGFDNVFSVALQADGRILLSGNTGAAGLSQIIVLRFTAVGTLDTSFGASASGVVILPLVGPSNIASGNAVVVQSNGAIVVAGYD